MTNTVIKFLLLLTFITHYGTSAYARENIITEDKPYEIINVSIPRFVWREAFNPTPVLKSPVTIVLPIHVPPDDENEVEEEDEVSEDVETTTTISVDEEQILEDVSEAPVVSSSPAVEDELPPADTPVTGQVVRFPCSCPSGQCGCCTGAILQRLNMKACGNISFVPEDFVFDVRLSVNNNTVVRRRVSASDPPPICFNPRRAPFVQVCAEISNIRIRNSNAYACMDINANIGGFPIYSASFRCFGLGSKGVQTGLKPKPVSSGPKPVSLFGNSDNDDSGGGLLGDAAGTIFGGDGGGGLFGGSEGGGLFGGSEGGGLFGGSEGGLFGGGGSDNDDDGGPFDALGDAVGGIFEERKIRRL